MTNDWRANWPRSVVVALAMAALPSVAAAQAKSDGAFPAGTAIRLIVGGGAGGPHDLYSRTLAKHMRRHIAGNPNIIVQYQPGAGGALAANHLYNVAARDGTVFGLLLQGVTSAQLLGGTGIKYDVTRMNWIGGLDETNSTLTLWHTAPASTVEQAKKVEIVLGSTGKASETYIHPALMNVYLGTRFKMVVGFRGFAPMDVAMESGELHGHTGTWNAWKTVKADWVRDKKIKHLVQIGLKRDPDLPDVPLLIDFAATDEQRTIFRFASASGVFGRSYLTPPGVPAARLATLRQAFEKTTRDPAFLAEAKALRMDLNPVPWHRLDATAREVMATSPTLVNKIKALIK
jgi:tripartite-type tricarboxylate transporter receptor subunit TctC